jgi:hypothetical protein
MGKMKSKALTRKEVAKICNRILFEKYINTLAKNVKRMQKEGRQSQKDMKLHMHFMQIDSSLTNLDLKLSKMATQLGDLLQRVLIQDYIIGRLSKPELIISLNELHPDDPLSTAEHLEEIDRKKDTFMEYIKDVIE